MSRSWMTRLAATNLALLFSFGIAAEAFAQTPAKPTEARTTAAESTKPKKEPKKASEESASKEEAAAAEKSAKDESQAERDPETEPGEEGASADSEESSEEAGASVEGKGDAEEAGTEEASDEESGDPEASDEEKRDLGQPRVIDISGQTPPGEPVEPEPEVRGSEVPFTYHIRHLDVALGLRFIGATDDGLEPFLEDPVLADLYARFGGAFQLTDHLALAIVGEGGVSGSESFVRGVDTSLELAHLQVGVEGRYHFIHRMYGYARVAPGLQLATGRYGEIEADTELSDSSSAFMLDAALGAAIRFAGTDDGREKGPRFWGFLEGGYRYAGSHELALEAADGEGPARAEPLTLAPLDTSGGFVSTGLALTF